MKIADFGAECENCECLTCVNNDDAKCQNCLSCNGNISYNQWMMDCKECEECQCPEETVQIVLSSINS
jgi:hypothetical protein